VTRVLADTSIWVAHFRRPNPVLQSLLAMDRVLCHPLIVIELACGSPPAPRQRTLSDLQRLQSAVVATTSEVLELIERRKLYDAGCGGTDIALLASALLTPDTRLWSLDKPLAALAESAGVKLKDTGTEATR
jgi:predicted nucleic acid-binding protein